MFFRRSRIVQLPDWKEDLDFTVASPVVGIETRVFQREGFGARFEDYFTSGEESLSAPENDIFFYNHSGYRRGNQRVCDV